MLAVNFCRRHLHRLISPSPTFLMTGDPEDPEDPEKAFSEADNYLEWSYRFDYTQSPVAPSIPSDSWPTVSGITETEARTQCQTAVRQLPFYSTCTNTVGTAVEQLISQCMRAIQVGSGTSWIGVFWIQAEVLPFGAGVMTS